MPKPNKSSASSGTRKKHAKKAAGQDDPDGPGQQKRKPQRGEKKLSKAQKRAQPKIKQYVPPPKPPAPPIPDPLDGQGLARTLPADLVVILRRLGKKDDVTRRKGLDELKEWVEGIKSEQDEVEKETKEVTLTSAVPVWLHHAASLLQSPSHRSLALSLHSELLSFPEVRTAITDTLQLGLLPGTQNRDVLGSWLVASLDEARRGGMKCWDSSTFWTGDEGSGSIHLTEQIPLLIEFFNLATLDPASLHDDIHPAPVSSTPAPTLVPKKGKGKVEAPPEPTAEEVALTAERSARYRIGGYAGLAWVIPAMVKAGIQPPADSLELLRRPFLWSALASEQVEDSLNMGYEQPGVRKATYGLLSVLLDVLPDEVASQEMLETLAEAVLGSCWSEKDSGVWQAAGPAVVRFLTRHRTAWQIASDKSSQDDQEKEDEDEGKDGDEGKDEDEDEDEAEDGDRADNNETDASTAAPSRAEPADDNSASSSSVSLAKPFADFLAFISTVNPQIPYLTYPLTTLIVSSIPETILPIGPSPSTQLETLYANLWAPVDARLLSVHSMPSQPSAFQVFFSEMLELTTFLIGRAKKLEADETVQWLVQEQLAKRAWVEGVLEGKTRSRTGAEPEAEAFGKALSKAADIDEGAVKAAMASLEESLLQRAFGDAEGTGKAGSSLLGRLTSVLDGVKAGASNAAVLEAVDRMVGAVGERAVQALQAAVTADKQDAAVLGGLVQGLVGRDQSAIAKPLVSVLLESLSAYVTSLEPALMVAILSAVSTAELQQALWHLLESTDIERTTRFALAEKCLSTQDGALLFDGCLDGIALEGAQSALNNGPGKEVTRRAIAKTPALSTDAQNIILALVCTAIHDQVDDLLNGSDVDVSTSALEFFSAYARAVGPDIVKSDIHLDALVAVHHLTHLLPRESMEEFAVPPAAADLWNSVSGLGKERDVIQERVDSALAEMLGQVSCRIQPAVLVDVALSSESPATLLKSFLPSADSMSGRLHDLASRLAPDSLCILDGLVPCTVEEDDAESAEPADAQGRTRTMRYVDALVRTLRADRQLALAHPDLLAITVQAGVLMQDGLAIPGCSRSLWTAAAASDSIKDVVREIEGALSYSIASVDEVDAKWHKAAVQGLKDGKVDGDWLQQLLVDLKAGSNDVAARAFRDVLSKHLRQCGVNAAEAEVWLSYALTLAERAPLFASAIVSAVKPILLDTDVFVKTQNRFASALTTIPPSKASSEGIPALRLLIASAPPSDAASLFLPQQRAILVLRHIASWLASDDADDFDESMEVYVAQIYTALAPVVQDLSGAHWDGIFDLIENGLESASLADVSSHALLYECLVLLQQVRDLCAANKSLRAMWVGKEKHLALVLSLFMQCRNATTEPVRRIQDILLELLQDVPQTAMEQADLVQLCELLQATSPEIQTTAYRILAKAIRARTVALVLDVEASVAEAEEGHTSKAITLPSDLIDLAAAGIGHDWLDEVPTVSHALSQLLAWLAIMDHFEDASRTLRWAYLDQLNSAHLLSSGLLPMLFAILGISEVGAWNFPSSAYEVDEFYTDLLSPTSLPDLAPLASHLYYRALVTLPSLMRAYYESLKDRQLSMSMLAFTARHYSPVIIRHEFSALREPSAMKQLNEEGLNVRIAQGGGASAAGQGAAEAIASYVVDEQPMEIGIRLPAEFPLKGVDVRDLKRVGVPENKWRGWLMSLQQTITSRNGLILEALSVFKRNVALHFEGVVECAICYSSHAANQALSDVQEPLPRELSVQVVPVEQLEQLPVVSNLVLGGAFGMGGSYGADTER